MVTDVAVGDGVEITGARVSTSEMSIVTLVREILPYLLDQTPWLLIVSTFREERLLLKSGDCSGEVPILNLK